MKKFIEFIVEKSKIELNKAVFAWGCFGVLFYSNHFMFPLLLAYPWLYYSLILLMYFCGLYGLRFIIRNADW